MIPVAALVACTISVSFSQEDEAAGPPRTNLDVFRMLAGNIARTVGGLTARSDSPSVRVSVLPTETAWYIEAALIEGLRESGFSVTSSDSSRYAAEFGLVEPKVEYTNIRRDGLFGSKLVDRKVSLLLSTKLVDRSSGAILAAKDFREDTSDTIDLSQVSGVENPNIRATKGTLPSEGFLSDIVEPVVVLSAVAVAIYLLFTVRS